MFIYHVCNYINEYKDELINYSKIICYKMYTHELIHSVIDEEDIKIMTAFAFRILNKYINLDNKTFFNKFETEQYLRKCMIVCLWISQKFHKDEIKCYSSCIEIFTGFNYNNIVKLEKKILKYIDYTFFSLYYPDEIVVVNNYKNEIDNINNELNNKSKDMNE